MPDDADELILKMQHLEAQAREAARARAQQGAGERLKTKAQQMAFAARQEADAAEAALRAADEQMQQAKTPGRSPLEAADLLVAGRAAAQDAKSRLVKARARLEFALDRMDDAERAGWNAFQAEARAEAHGELAEDPLLEKPRPGAPGDPTER